MTLRVRILGIGMGPQHVTPEVSEALRAADRVVAFRKGEDDGLLDVRREICAQHGVELVEVADPPREREPARVATSASYDGAVRDWHDARAAAVGAALGSEGIGADSTIAFLVWGDPSLYDSTIRVAERLAARSEAAWGEVEWDVLPGISAPQLLAARHRLVLHQVGQPVHVTTARRLADDIAAGQRNLVVFLTGPDLGTALTGLEEWRIWWGANLGTPSEELVGGVVGDVLPAILDARDRAKQQAGWMMDLYLLRAPS